MLIGNFRYDDRRDIYVGEIYSLTLRTPVTIEPNRTTGNERAPEYRLMADGREIGAGWKRSSRDRGTPFLSIHIDDPSLPQPIEAVLSEAGDLVWNRPRLRPVRTIQPAPTC